MLRNALRLPAVALLVAAGFVSARRLLRRSRGRELRGSVVLITGSSRGLGLAMAEEFARRGCRVALCARDPDRLERARRRVEAIGAEVIAVPCDVRDPASVERLIEDVTQQFGRIDILVNNAGSLVVGPVERRTIEDFETAMQVMFWGVLRPIFAVLPQMRRRGDGTIVNITSVGGKMSTPHLVPYSSAKFAAVGLSEGLRAELGLAGIAVLTVVPGLMRTGSYLNAEFIGQHRGEFGWFAIGASLPGLSMDGAQAAREIVEATSRGETEIILGWPAQLAARVNGLMPGVTGNVLAVVARVLPGAPRHGRRDQTPGWKSGSPITDSMLTELGRKAARRFMQTPPR